MLFVSRLIALILAFTLGIAVGVGVIFGGVGIVLSEFTLRSLEDNNIIEIPDEGFIGENPKVDILDLTAFQLIEEYQNLQSFGDDLTINLLQDRYAIIFNEKIDSFLTDDVREMPLKKFLSKEGLHTVLETVYIGDIEKYVCYNADGTEGGDPADETSYWVNPSTNTQISGLEEIIADFSLADFMDGNINTTNLLDDIVISDVLGYTYDEEQNAWIDNSGNKVTGIMAVFADCHIDEVSEKMNTVELGELLGYEKKDDGLWYQTNAENVSEPVSGFMSKIANSNLNSVGSVFDTLVIGDVVSAKDMESGIFAIIPSDTNINDIGSVVNDSIMKSPLQFFINEKLITLNIEKGDGTYEDMSSLLDQTSQYKNDYKTYAPDDKDYLDYFDGVAEWSTDASGNYLVPNWRTQALSASFGYIISLLTTM